MIIIGEENNALLNGDLLRCCQKLPWETTSFHWRNQSSQKTFFQSNFLTKVVSKCKTATYLICLLNHFSIFQFRRNRSYWTYPGSLTTPPLHESVRTEIGKQMSWILSIRGKISTSKCDASHKHQHLKLCRWHGLSSNSQLKSPQFRLTITFRMTRITGTIWWHLRPTNWLREFGPNVHIHR